MIPLDRIKQLYKTYKNREITDFEFEELLSIINSDKSSEDEFVKMIEQDLLDNNISEDSIVNKIADNAEINILSRTCNPKKVRRIKPMYYAIAASILIILSASLAYFNSFSQKEETPVENEITTAEDIAPGGNKASLKISDGRIFSLDDKHNHISTSADAILLSDGNKLGELSETIVELELSTPRKGNYQALLPDGTRVWLNAESKIIYPSKFAGPNRTIKVTGEVYLEVAKVNNSKFIVELAENRQIEVLGTKFNINAYPDQSYIKTSLLEGKIKLSNASGQNAVLTPGHKAILHNSTNNIMISDTNIDNDLAWLNNKFNFEDLTFEEIMKQIARWYDVDIIYPSKIPDTEFYGELNKNNSLKYIIDVFKHSDINMQLKNRSLIIEESK